MLDPSPLLNADHTSCEEVVFTRPCPRTGLIAQIKADSVIMTNLVLRHSGRVLEQYAAFSFRRSTTSPRMAARLEALLTNEVRTRRPVVHVGEKACMEN